MTRSSTAAPPKPAPDTELKRLAIFVGTWNLEGRQLVTRVGQAAEITGTERYEWLTGGFFLVHHFDAPRWRRGGVHRDHRIRRAHRGLSDAHLIQQRPER